MRRQRLRAILRSLKTDDEDRVIVQSNGQDKKLAAGVAWAGAIFLFSTDLFPLPIPLTPLAFSPGCFRLCLTKQFRPYTASCGNSAIGPNISFLAVLLLRALQNESGEKNAWRHAAQTTGLVFLYALSDEWHQSFVPSRTASFGDVMIDVLGGICGIFWMVWYQRGIRTPLISRLGYHKSLKHDDKIAKKT